MEYKTVFVNNTSCDWWIPKGLLFGDGLQKIVGRSSFEFVGDEAAPYARYEKVTLISYIDDTGTRRYEVRCERCKTWEPPKRRGWALTVINTTGDVLSNYSYRCGSLCVQAPAGIEVTLYNVSPMESLAVYSKIERSAESVRRWADPRVPGGYRQTIEGGTFEGTLRPEEELKQIEVERSRIAAHAIMPALAQLEAEKITDEKSR